MCVYRVYGKFTLEAIVATAFGRQVDIQRGDSDEFSKAMDIILEGFADGQLENFMLFHSKPCVHFIYLFPSIFHFLFRSFSMVGDTIEILLFLF